MKRISSLRPISKHVRDQTFPFIKENGKIIGQFVLTILFIGIGIWFIKHEQAELLQVKEILFTASIWWMITGILLTIGYIILQGYMYVASFLAVGARVSPYDATILFLKRNLISVFLPAGGLSSLAFFSRDIENKGISKTQIHFASTIYAFIGIASVVLVAIPVFIYAIFEGTISTGEWIGFVSIILIVANGLLIYRSVMRKGLAYKWLAKLSPTAEILLIDLQKNSIDRKGIIYCLIISVFIEIVGIAHLYIAMMALHAHSSFLAALMGYIISVIFLIVSPFLRGLGALEVSMSFVLTRFGYSTIEAISITFFYRFLEFWLPLAAGIVSFLIKAGRLLIRIVPALLLLVLGIVNIISVLTPAIGSRVQLLQTYLPGQALEVSNYFVLTAGFFLLVTAAFMLKGLRIAWYFSLFLCVISLIGNLTKAIDYEESGAALVVLIILISSRKEYYVKHNPRLRNIGLKTTFFSILAVLIYGIGGFYFLDKKHFDVDFNFLESIRYTIENYFLIDSGNLKPRDTFAQNFLFSIKLSGFLSLTFLLYTLVRPYVIKTALTEDEYLQAKELLKKYGNSAMDYFKLYKDKMIFKPDEIDGFVSYRVSRNFAVVLENPVAGNQEDVIKLITLFDSYCHENGLNCIYYRVPQGDSSMYLKTGKKKLFLGQEGVVDLSTFNLEGGTKKSMRNALKKVTDKGFKAVIHKAPVKDGLLQRIKAVSDEWLADTKRDEIVFSQGMFIWEELKQQTIITVESPEEKIVAFINLIPDYANGEGTYDLIRKTADAPNGVIDFILVEAFNHMKSEGLTSVNIGFAPLSGISAPRSFQEKSMKFAYEKIRSLSHYKGLRDFKEKFSPVWSDRYLIYSDDYDLLQIPTVLSKVIKP